MKYRYTKFTGDDLDELDLEELLSKLSDLFLGSGFDNPYGMPYEDDDEAGHSRQSLHDAIMEAILNGGMLSEETLERLLGKDWRDADDAEQRLDQLIDKIIEKLQAQGYLSGQPDLEKERERREGAGRRHGQHRAVPVRDHRQEPRLPRLQGAARSARLARQEQPRPPRHARDGDRHRGQRRVEAVRVRRHDESRRQRDDHERGAANEARSGSRGPRTEARSRQRPRAPIRPRPVGHRRRLPGPDGRAGRVPELVRDGADARLQPQHDPLRRGSLHAGEARGAGAGQPDPHAVSGRRAEGRAVPRLGRGDPARPAGALQGRARTTPTRAKGSASPAASSSGSRRTCGRS